MNKLFTPFFMVVLLFVLNSSLSLWATPAVQSQTARDFLGGRTGKIAYLKGYDTKIYFVDLSDSILTEHKLSDDPYCLSPMIHPDGTRIVYEQGSSIWIRDLVENSSTRTFIYSRSPVLGQTMEPHWWIDPTTKDEYVQFSTGIIEDHEWPPKKGSTYIIKIVKNQPVGAPLVLLPFMMTAGRSKNGAWGATGGHSVGMYRFYPDKVDNALYSMKNWMDFGVILACNTSISPSNDPLKENRMMHLHSGGTLIHGKVYENHKAVLIRSWDDPDADDPFWYMGSLGDQVENDSSGNLFWGAPEWSTDENYFTLTGTKDVDGVDTADLYIAKLNLTGTTKLLRVIKGEGKNVYSHLWIKDGISPAKMRIDSTKLQFNSFSKDTADPIFKTVTITNSGDGTLPSISIDALPKWLTIKIGGNGTNTIKLVNQVHRDSAGIGNFQAPVSVTFGHGVDSVSYLVSFQYSDRVLTSIKSIPSQAYVEVGDSVQLSGVGLDQAGNPMADQPSTTWSGSGKLKPTSNGWFKADTTAGQSYLALGKSGNFICTTTVTVTRKLLRVDVGALKDQNTVGWLPDTGFTRDGIPASTKLSPNLLNLLAPAPIPVYQRYRKDFSVYQFSNLLNGRYRVRFHLVSPSLSSNGSMSIKLEGIKVVDGFSFPTTLDSTVMPVQILEAMVSVSDGNGLSLEATFSPNGPALAGLEIIDLGLPPVSIVSPNGGEKFSIGDTVSVQWKSDSTISSVGVQVSIDSGLKWIPLTRRHSIDLGTSEWQNFHWIIPDSLDGFSLFSNKAMISVYDYFGTDRDRSDKVFTIFPGATGIRYPQKQNLAQFVSAYFAGTDLNFDLNESGRWQVNILDLRGKNIRSFSVSGVGHHIIGVGNLSQGVYRMQFVGPHKTYTQIIAILP